jgi:hypothetical protein
MALPTHAQMNEAVDARFFEQHPDAPRKLDPNDPAQAPLVADWLKIRDDMLNEWTDYYFFEFYPDAPRQLDSNDPAHHDLIEFWNDIHHQLLTGQPGRWSWDSAVPRTADASAEPPLQHVSVEAIPDRTGFIVHFNRPTGVLEVEAYVWPGQDHLPVGCGVEVSPQGASQATIQTTVTALSIMRPDLANEMSQLGILTAE